MYIIIMYPSGKKSNQGTTSSRPPSVSAPAGSCFSSQVRENNKKWWCLKGYGWDIDGIFEWISTAASVWHRTQQEQILYADTWARMSDVFLWGWFSVPTRNNAMHIIETTENMDITRKWSYHVIPFQSIIMLSSKVKISHHTPTISQPYPINE